MLTCFGIIRQYSTNETQVIFFFFWGGAKNNIPEVFLTRKAKNMNHGSPLFPTIK